MTNPTAPGVRGGPIDPVFVTNPVTIDGVVPVSGDGLTNEELRASPVPVSGTVTATTGGLTDTQLRATPVPVSGTITATTGGLTDTQLRASAVPVSFGIPNDIVQAIALSGSWQDKTAYQLYVLGRRTTFANTTHFQDVAQYLVGGQNAINTANGATTYYLVSTSANDTNGGTGANTVRIVYLDSNGDQQVTTKTLNGLTAVNIGAGYYYIQWMEVASVGSNNSSVGDVTIGSINGAATEATTIEMVKAGGNRSLSARYKVPTGYTAYAIDWGMSAINQPMDVRLRALVFADNRASSSVFHFQATAFPAAGQSFSDDLHLRKFIAGTEIKVSCFPNATTGSPRLDVNVDFIVIQN